MNRNIYLNMKTLQKAQEILFGRFDISAISKTETIKTIDSVGRLLAKPVFARMSSPCFHACAMDGIAVKAESTYGACEGEPKILNMGKEAFWVNTGNPLPHNCDAVIMIEYVNILDKNRIEIENPAFPWQNIRKTGEDIVAAELVFTSGHKVTPHCIGALLSAGIFSVEVRKKPKALIIPTGSELVDCEENSLLNPGQVLETNSYVLGKLIESYGGEFLRHKIIKDEPDKIKQAIKNGLANGFDMVLLTGGSSAGSEDYTKSIIESLGQILVHGVTIMPGKPVIIADIQGKPVFGMPGYPVSAIIAFEQFAGPLINKILGISQNDRQKINVQPVRKIPSKLGVEEFVRVKLGKVGNKIIAAPLPRAAGCITSLTQAHGIIRIPNQIEGIKENETIEAELLQPLSSIQNTIFIVGSHDNTLDILADNIYSASEGKISISSSHVGSIGGLMGIKKGISHIAGAHLLDPQDGSYNISYIKKYLQGIDIKLVNLVLREQGLIIPKGNPKNIKGIEDIAKPDILFINRQGGSGTRILLDYKLNLLGIDPNSINGYQNEEFTHMSVAVAVLSGAADAGLGIYAAAKALNLDFIPVITEQYDLVIPENYFNTPNIQMLLNIINSADFKKQVEALGGYNTQKTGSIFM